MPDNLEYITLRMTYCILVEPVFLKCMSSQLLMVRGALERQATSLVVLTFSHKRR